MVNSLCNIIASATSKKEGKAFKKNIYKFAIKASLLFDSKKINMENAIDLKYPLEEYTNAVAVMLKNAKNEESEEKMQKSLDYFCTKRIEVGSAIMSLMAINMTEKNIKLLRYMLLEILTREDLVKILKAESSRSDREILLNGAIVLLDKSNTFSPGVHTIVMSNSIFSDKYSAVIVTVRNVWKAYGKSREDAHAILKKFCGKSSEYSKKLQKIPNGNSLELQEEALVEFIDKVVKMLEMWETLVKDLEDLRKTVLQWAKGMDVKKVLDDLDKAIFDSIGAVLGKDFKSVDKKRCNIISKLVFKELCK